MKHLPQKLDVTSVATIHPQTLEKLSDKISSRETSRDFFDQVGDCDIHSEEI